MPDCHGQTPLFFAPTGSVCKVLLTNRADITTLNHAGQSALHIAALAGLQDVFSWLSTKADANLTEVKDLNGCTAGDYALQSCLKINSSPCSPRESTAWPASSPSRDVQNQPSTRNAAGRTRSPSRASSPSRQQRSPS